MLLLSLTPQEWAALLTAALLWERVARERALNMVSAAVIMKNPLAVILISCKSNIICCPKRQKITSSSLLWCGLGIGGLQFGVQPHTAAINGAANYGVTYDPLLVHFTVN